MEQFELFSTGEQSYSVSELTLKLRNLIEEQPELQSLWVEGEVSNLSRPQSGHWYFTLKDEGAELKAVMWRGLAGAQAYVPNDGDAIEVHGNISIYEARGQYQLYADEIRPAGQGALYEEYLRLKNKLEEEGLFDPEHKLELPLRPEKIGIITSPTGAALRDILNTLNRRYPLAEIILASAAVQGVNAPAELLAVLKNLQEHKDIDLIIMARGGGSIEDLAAFNDEVFARAIFESSIPIISGVGHETDFSISDFVADLRAPTPTAAAELATPNTDEILLELSEYSQLLSRSIINFLQDRKWALQNQQSNLDRRSPRTRLTSEQGSLENMQQSLKFALRNSVSSHKASLNKNSAQLKALNPQKVLARGYSVVSNGLGKIISSRAKVQQGDQIKIEVTDGTYQAEVIQEEK